MISLQEMTRIIFFTGKGGVGKTSAACATAVQLADAGRKVLLVSTDPASNLDEVLEVPLSGQPTAIPAVDGLWGLNLDPERAAADYRERMVGPYRGLLPEAALRSMEEQFSGSCTIEIAAFDEFSRLLAGHAETQQFDHVIFDTAPTGHTLRLLALPSAWTGFIHENKSGTSCLGPLAGLQAQRKLYEDTVAALKNSAITTMVLVSRAETSALKEAARTCQELLNLGVQNQRLLINGVFHAVDRADSIAVAMEQRGQQSLQAMPAVLQQLPQIQIPYRPSGVLGVAALREFGSSGELDSEKGDFGTAGPAASASQQFSVSDTEFLSPEELVNQLVEHGHGVILTMGKGGVGKTTVAGAIAVALAARGFPVHLSTTDPAAHLNATMEGAATPRLTVSRIDPVEETRKYTAHVLEQSAGTLDAQGIALLEEDLRSPCTEEIAVFRAFAEAVAEGQDRFVVLDTAPTGHTILLLDAALAYHREVLRQSAAMPSFVQELLPRLRDPSYTRVVLVCLAEATPVHEAAALQGDLRRAGIEPFAWVVNQVLSPLPITDANLKIRQAHEQRYLAEVRSLSSRAVVIPWTAEPPVGQKRLLELLAPSLFTKGMGTMYPELTDFLINRKAEFDQIPAERKVALGEVAAHVTASLKKMGRSQLTFICTHNSRRSHLSQIWAGVAAQYYGLKGVLTYSGGTEVTAFNPRAVASLRRSGLRIETPDSTAENPHYFVRAGEELPEFECFSKVFNQSPNPVNDYVAVMTCSHADEACPVVMGCDLRAPIRYEDPKIADDTPREAEVYDERSRQICREMLFLMSQVSGESK